MFVQMLFWIIPLLFLSRRDQCFRIVALEQQLAVYQRQQGGKRLQLTDEDRRFWVMLRRRWPQWREALVIVKPETVVAWHRKLGRWWQRRQRRRLGRPPLPEHVQDLIRRIAAENPLWGQDRIAGELGKLGIEACYPEIHPYPKTPSKRSDGRSTSARGTKDVARHGHSMLFSTLVETTHPMSAP